ncbi:hypothetical protein FSP39_002363 [Pinctada imbricata]|uniref:Iron-binding zinc finger CDGSH type domain-containing protein n=1 Tax=Pinctada imbricata TaxID=66713 RepID=A0AA88YUQ6_PINIB|nr:hypothetical protein FSP39_002363 [Pinctada imbricata]
MCDYEDVKDLLTQKKRKHPETPKTNIDPTEIIKGKMWDKKPFRVELKADKRYSWCACGYSKNQPFCDGSHRALSYQLAVGNKKIHIKPHRFKVEETKEYWLCNCKQTDNRPFCDGSHKKPEVAAITRGPGPNF